MRMMRIASTPMAKKAAAALVFAAAYAAFAPSAGATEPYSLFVDGWPAENPKSESASPGCDIATATVASASVANALEARSRTSAVAAGTSLKSFPPGGCFIIVR